MGSNGGDEVMASGSGDTMCPNATVEIKVVTLDSQTYKLRVDRCVPVPALKDQIATVTGVESELQRLICRGRVLKDDQLLSAYHVEDGHTLHLVVRRAPAQLSVDGPADDSENDPVSNSGHRANQTGQSVVIGTFNITEPGDGAMPDLSRIVSAVLGSFGVSNIGSSTEGVDLSEATPEGLFRTARVGLRNSGGQQVDPNAATDPFFASAPLDPLQLPVIPDSLTTLSQYLIRMRDEFSAVVRRQAVDSDAGERLASGGLPTPATLAEVIMSTRRLLIHQSADSLSQLAGQLENQANVTDTLARMTTQSNAIRTGVILQHLGALLMELGRTTMTLRMGQTPAESVVNAGPAVFISTSGPNPIMVQPLHYQPGASFFGTIPTGTGQHGTGSAGVSVGSAFLPRNIDIRIRSANQREAAGVQQSPPGQNNQSSTPDVHADAPPVASGIPSSTRESGIRVIPVRTVVAALPASLRGRPSATSDTSRGGSFIPVVARVQRVSSGNLVNQTSSQPAGQQQQPYPAPTVPPQGTGLSGGNANASSENGARQGFSTDVPSSFDQLLRTIFQGSSTVPATSDSRPNQGAPAAATSTQESAPPVSGDGVFLSNILRQIMPMISENTAGGSAAGGGADDAGNMDTQTPSTQGQDDSDRGARSSRRGDPPSSPASKRQRRQ